MKSTPKIKEKSAKINRKQAYMSELSNGNQIKGRALNASELPFITQHYANKFGITIHINGQHESIKNLWSDIEKPVLKNSPKLNIDTKYQQFMQEQEPTKVTTLQSLLEKNPENAVLLKDFKEFKARWIKAYDEAMEKRKAMQDQKHNQYLAYKTHAIHKEMHLYRTPNAQTKPTYLGDWHTGIYYVLQDTPKALYYVDYESNQHTVENVDLENLLERFQYYNYRILSESDLQNLNLTAHLQCNNPIPPESSNPLVEEELEIESIVLAKAKTLPLFLEHRSNSLFTGAWDRTSAIKQIHNNEKEIVGSNASSFNPFS